MWATHTQDGWTGDADDDRTLSNLQASVSGQNGSGAASSGVQHAVTSAATPIAGAGQWPRQRSGCNSAWPFPWKLGLSNEALHTTKLLAAGGIAGAVSKTVTAPLARLTILFQVQGLSAGGGVQQQFSTRQALAHVVRSEGLCALWKGNGVTIIHRLPYSSLNFWAYEKLTEYLTRVLPSDGTTDVLRRLGAGGVAGMTACAVAYPLDLVRTRLAAQTGQRYYRGVVHALRTIVADEGAVGLYRGLGATLLQVGPSLAINYCTYESLRAYALARQEDKTAPSVGSSLVCGSLAGLVSSTATFPLDLVRRRMQLVGQHGCEAQRRRYGEVVRCVVRQQGLRGLYAGIVPEYLKVIPGVAIAFCTYECCKSLLGVQVNTFNR